MRNIFFCRKTFFFLFHFVLCTNAEAQVKDTVNIGTVKGIVQDSAFNFVLTSATVAVYRDSDSTLLQYCLPNSFGEFTISSLPVDVALRMVITHVGYRAFSKKIYLSKGKHAMEFGKLNLIRKTEGETELSEIVISPVRMNGDTLEFSAAAFKVDKNATTEDLLRRLPGFTIWGDGEITFNGKKINALLVDGKPFMGGDFATITQNLPKDAIQKVQVYQQVNQTNLYDSTTHVNLKLKEDKKIGRFGKVSAGYGTDDRYAADAMMNAFNKKMQINVVGALNNINKQASNAQQLLENSTFKGEGASIDYQPNFRMQGLNKPAAAGVTFQYDFIPDPNWQNTHRLNADYFLNSNNALNERNTVTNRFLGKDSLLSQNSNSHSTNSSISQRASARYEKNNAKYRFTISGSANLNNSHSQSESSTQQERTGAGVISTSESKNESNRQSKNYGLTIILGKQEVEYNRKRPRNFSVTYTVDVADNNGRSVNNTKFRSVITPSLNKDYSRLYDRQDQFSMNNILTLDYPSLKQLIFGRKRFWNIGMGLSNTLTLNNNSYNDTVQDYDTTLKIFKQNSYLTNKRELDIVNVEPALNLSKSISKQLSNRYYKSFTIVAKIRGQYYNMQHRATQTVQNFNQEYKRFTPDVRVSYYNSQYGRYTTNIALNFTQASGYPQVNQISPLIDSSNVLYLPKGNKNIGTQTNQSVGFNYNLNGVRANKTYMLNINLSIGQIKNMITDSSFYDASGRQIVYYTNVNGNKYFNTNFSYRRPFKINKSNTIQTTLSSSFNINQTPGYVNSVLNNTGNRSSNSSIGITYSLKNLLTVNIQQQINFNRSEQHGFRNDVFKSNTVSSVVSAALQFPKNLTWSSNVTFNSSTANKQNVKFTLLNAGITYRFLKGNRGEVKFSALDLLRQNKSIVNSAGPNYQTFGYANVLQQYYMLTFSFYPRKFGR